MSTRSSTLSTDRVIQRDIATAIYEQRMPPGTRLSEAGLGTLYGVSRTVVRKALLRLASDKLVESRPNRGARVRQPSVDEAREIFAARRLIETGLLAASVPLMTSADHARLHALVAEDCAAQAADDRQRAIRASGDFHRALAAPAGNDVLATFLDELIGRTSLIIALYQSRAAPGCSHAAHEVLLAPIEHGDVPAAQQALDAHLVACETALDLVAPHPPSSLADMLAPTAAPL